MAEVVILHNPACSKSREALALLEASGIAPRVVHYLEAPPTVAELDAIVRQLGVGPRAIMRLDEPEYASLGLDDPELARELRSRLVAPRRRELLEMIDRGVADAQLPSDTDRDTLADLLVSPLYYRALISGEPFAPDTTRRIVTAVLDPRSNGDGP